MTQVNHKQLFVIAVPMILSNITAPLLGLVDTAVIGHLPHAYYLGGSTVGAMIITFVTWLCGFLRMSTTGLSAQASGRQDMQQAMMILARGLLVAAVIGFSLILLQYPYIEGALYLAGGSDKVQEYAQYYAEIRVWGLPAALANIVLTGWLLGQQKAKAVMWLMIAINLTNLMLDVIFVIYLGLGVQGVATATLIAEYTGLMLGLSFIAKYYKQHIQRMMTSFTATLQQVVEGSALRAYFNLNKDILIRTLCLELCFVFITFQGARMGDDIVAANAILMNFLLLISFGLDGVANAAEVLVGKAKGQVSAANINKAVSLSLFWTLIFAFAYCLVFFVAGEYSIGLITNITSVKETAMEYLPWVVMLPLLGCWCYLFDGVYVGLTNAKVMRNSMIFATFGCFFPLWFLFSGWQNHGLWLAFCTFMVARGVSLMWHYYRIERYKLVA